MPRSTTLPRNRARQGQSGEHEPATDGASVRAAHDNDAETIAGDDIDELIDGFPDGGHSQDAPEKGDSNATSSTSVMSLRILEILAERKEESAITHIASVMGVPKARVHRHLVALKQQGYVMQNPKTSRYRIGWRLFLLGQRVTRQFDVVALARPVMEELRDQVAQTIVITTFTDDDVIVLDLVRGRSPLEILLNPGTQFAFHSVAQGKIALAFGAPERMEKLLRAPLVTCTSHTITDPERLRLEVALVRERGWAEAPEEVFLGVNALAAPLRYEDGTLFGAIAIVGSIHYLPARADPDTVDALKRAAAKISAMMGGGNGM